MAVFDFIDDELKELKAKGLYRTLRTPDGKLNFCSNNYLGLANHPQVVEMAIKTLKKHGIGSGASRLVSGNLKVHEELERVIADHEGTKASIVFPTGYMANLGTIQSLVGEGDAVIIDRLDHASIVDGARLSGAKLLVYPHKDIDALEKVLKKAFPFKKKLIVSDHVFSMDGDIAPVDDLIKLSAKYEAMIMLDVAHATGVIEAKPGKNVIIMGTLSKAIGSLGGFVAGDQNLIDYLRNKARAFIYTTALPPAIAAASIAAFKIIAKNDSLKKKLWENVRYINGRLKPMGFDTLGSQTQIIPIMVGEPGKAVAISEYLFDEGILLSAIRPPTVPQGTSRLRLTVTAMHTKQDIDLLIEKLAEVKEKFNG